MYDYSNFQPKILLGNGDGTFTLKGPLGTGQFSSVVGVGDFNEDDIPDLLVSTNSGLLILLGNGDGTFKETTTLTFPDGLFSPYMGDFNGDGNLDLLMLGGQLRQT